MVILRDKIHFYEGQKLLDSLADTWDFFFCDVLSMLQAIFYPVQGKEPSLRQVALLHFRNIITLNLKLDDALCRPRARVPPSIIQMLLLLQGVHESKGVTDDYLRLEALIQKVVSPYLGTHGLYSRDGSSNLHCSSCLLEKRFRRSWPSKPGNSPIPKNPVVRSKSYNVPMLTPVVEYDSDSFTSGGAGVRRHSVSEMTSCLEESGSLAESTATNDSGHTSTSSAAGRAAAALPGPRLLQPQNPSPCLLPEPSPGEDTLAFGSLASDSSPSSGAPPPDTTSDPGTPSSLEPATTGGVPELLDTEAEHSGIFLDFSLRRSRGLEEEEEEEEEEHTNAGRRENNATP
ncbi:proline-rich protein 5-like [Spinachia spinachia]